jgi:general secretion pathway protein E
MSSIELLALSTTWLATLTAQGKLAAVAVDRIERLHAETGDPFDVILARLGLVAETDIAQAFADALAIPLTQAADVPAEPALPDQLRSDFLRPARVLPLTKPADALHLAMANPANDNTANAIAYAPQRPVLNRVAPASEIERWFDRLYGMTTPANPQPTAAPDAARTLTGCAI